MNDWIIEGHLSLMQVLSQSEVLLLSSITKHRRSVILRSSTK